MNEDMPFKARRRAGSPYWQIQFGKTGPRISSKQTDYDAAVAWAWKRVNGPDPSKRPVPSVREFSEDFLVVGRCPIIRRLRSKGNAFGNRNASDRRGQLVNHIWPQFGQRKISSLWAAEIEDWLIARPGSNQLKNQILATFMHVFYEARRNRFITSIPTDDINRFAVDSEKRPAFERDEYDALFAGPIDTWKSRWGDETIAIATFTAANTGMRLGEIRALQWHQIDFAEELIYVVQNADSRDNTIKTPKNEKPRPVLLYPAQHYRVADSGLPSNLSHAPTTPIEGLAYD